MGPVLLVVRLGLGVSSHVERAIQPARGGREEEEEGEKEGDVEGGEERAVLRAICRGKRR